MPELWCLGAVGRRDLASMPPMSSRRPGGGVTLIVALFSAMIRSVSDEQKHLEEIRDAFRTGHYIEALLASRPAPRRIAEVPVYILDAA